LQANSYPREQFFGAVLDLDVPLERPDDVSVAIDLTAAGGDDTQRVANDQTLGVGSLSRRSFATPLSQFMAKCQRRNEQCRAGDESAHPCADRLPHFCGVW